ncbi:MAG TPA: STAS/SEC14 domain-containing protein [Polyangiaceae bacterium]|nr:STAS/SEC14 domain-containing protein [Polyangiaceae bacterium]
MTPTPAAFEVWLDEERQIIRQRLHGTLDLASFLQLIAASGACAQRLHRPDEIRILVEEDGMGRPGLSMRQVGLEHLRRPGLKRMALVTTSRVARVLFRFVMVASGGDKARVFGDEASAIRWLLS